MITQKRVIDTNIMKDLRDSNSQNNNLVWDIGEESSYKLSKLGSIIMYVNQFVSKRYFWYIFALGILLCIFSYAPSILTLFGLGPRPDWELAYYVALYRVVFVLGATIASWRFGTTVGIITCTVFTLLIFSPLVFGLPVRNIWLEIGLFILGILVSLVFGRLGNMQKLLAENARELQTKATTLKIEVAERKKAEKELRTLSLHAIESLVAALEAKDKYTAGHSRRVTDIAVIIGNKMGLSLQELEDLRCSSLLHDVGKIGVDHHIQNKPGSLTPVEYEQIMLHVSAGANIVRPIVNKRIVELIEHHHDRYDGSGLNQALYGDNIPLGARIIAVADAFDAMTSDRPYRSAMTREEAINEILHCAGTQFDPIVVNTFLNIPLHELNWAPAIES